MADYDLHEFTARLNSMISDYQTKIANFGADELPFINWDYRRYSRIFLYI